MKKMAAFLAIFFIAIGFQNQAKAENYDYLIYLPFEHGEKWYCTQGNNGSFSHYGKLKYAYDFNKGFSIWGQINPAFGESILSPIHGEIVEKRTEAPDFIYNDGPCEENNWGWGNTLLIYDYTTGMYIRLAHIKNNSIPQDLNEGDTVQIGQKIGEVGCSGWSTNTHLHIHMQYTPNADAQSVKFHFVEGEIETGDWVKSELIIKSFILDTDENISLSHNVTSFTTYRSSEWQKETGIPPNIATRGNRYIAKKKPGKPNLWHKWIFRTDEGGYYYIQAKYKCAPENTNIALYSITSFQDPDVKTKVYRSQQVCTANNWHPIILAYLYPNTWYVFSVIGKFGINKTFVADAIMFVKLF